MGQHSRRPPKPGMFKGECRGKMGYPSRKQAAGRARVIKATDTRAKTLAPYRCPACKQWHIGNSARRLT